MNIDVFELIKNNIDVMYISCLPLHKKEVLLELANLNIDRFDIKNMQDFFAYVFQKKINSYEDIKVFIQKYKERSFKKDNGGNACLCCKFRQV